MKSDFSEHGDIFQKRLLRAFLFDPHFAVRIHSILKSSHFPDKINQLIFEHIESFEHERSVLPDIHDLQSYLNSSPNVDEAYRPQVALRIKEINQLKDDLEYTKDEAIKFCKHQEMYHVLRRAVDEWEQNNYDKIAVMVSDALRLGEDKIDGTNYFDLTDFDMRLSEAIRNPIPTGLDRIDEMLHG